MRGINVTTKSVELVDIFKNGKIELVALTETKLKGKREVSWSGGVLRRKGTLCGYHIF